MHLNLYINMSSFHLANHKDVIEPSGKDMALGVLDVANVE